MSMGLIWVMSFFVFLIFNRDKDWYTCLFENFHNFGYSVSCPYQNRVKSNVVFSAPTQGAYLLYRRIGSIAPRFFKYPLLPHISTQKLPSCYWRISYPSLLVENTSVAISPVAPLYRLVIHPRQANFNDRKLT